MFYGIFFDILNFMANIIEYYVKYWQSYITLLCVWMML